MTSEVKSMPNIFRYSLDKLLEEITVVEDLGIRSIALFPLLSEDKKDKFASESHRQGSLYLEAIHQIKNKFPAIALMTDVAMDPYSSDGHDGYVDEKGNIQRRQRVTGAPLEIGTLGYGFDANGSPAE